MSSSSETILAQADELCSANEVATALQRMAAEITAKLGAENPLVLCVMKGAVVFAGQLLPLLRFPMGFDYLHATRYRDQTQGGDIHWEFFPQGVAGRQVLVLDDILDEGHTLAAIRERCLAEGATAFYSAVLLEKVLLQAAKPIAADFVGLRVPDRYVFGCGMDVNGLWRNLPAIYALR